MIQKRQKAWGRRGLEVSVTRKINKKSNNTLRRKKEQAIRGAGLVSKIVVVSQWVKQKEELRSRTGGPFFLAREKSPDLLKKNKYAISRCVQRGRSLG